MVSVLIPIYNAGPFLRECLDSVVNQTYRDLQICLVNDGSTDNSGEICKEYCSRDNRIEYVEKKNEGVAATRNRLLDMARGDAVLFVDADDWIEPDMVEYLFGLRERTGADVACCSVVDPLDRRMVDIEETTLNRREVIKKFLFHRELTGSLCNKLVKTSLLHRVRFPVDIGYGEDAFVCWQILQKTDKFALSNKQLYHYRMNPDSISHNSFGPKKLTANKVWQAISSRAEEYYPDMAYIARARQGMEMTLLLLAAARDGVKKNSDIAALQKVVRKNFRDMLKAKITSPKGLAFAGGISLWYGPFKLLKN